MPSESRFDIELLQDLGVFIGFESLEELLVDSGSVQNSTLRLVIRPELPNAERLKLFSGHSLRAGLASYAEVDERHVQKQLGHASLQMTRRYQRRRDRFRVNLTKAAGL